jgi:SET domain-containing protein
MKNILEVRNSRFGKGLFANIEIPAGSLLYKIPTQGPEIDFRKTTDLKEKESHALQIDFDRYIFCEPPFLFANHSCNPNCGVNIYFQVIALRNILKGEELTWDYSTSMLERHWTMACGCGESSCRKTITDFDLLPRHLQSYYLENNLVLPFIAAFMKQQFARSA